MKTYWTEGLTGPEKESRRKEVLGYRNAFDDLSKILDKLKEEEELPPKYDSPSWAYEQADRNGANRMLRKIQSIINLN